jgi:SAM-dependent methyltransferase
LSNILSKLHWSIHHRGVGGTMRAVTNSLGRRINPQPLPATHPFDLAHGTDTGGLIPGCDLASGHDSDSHIEGYAAVPPSRFRATIARWQASKAPHNLDEYCFIDLGCGKGRALLLASEYDFREVVGVELNPPLTVIARSNVNIWIAEGNARSPIRVEQKDALDLEWAAGPCIVFLFNPFDDALTRQVAERLAIAFRDRPLDLEVLYYKPPPTDAFARDFEMIWCESVPISPEDLAIDPVADKNDETKAYRLARKGNTATRIPSAGKP